MRGRWSARAFALCSLWLSTSALRADVTLDNFTAAVTADDQPVALDLTGAPTYFIDESMGLRPSADPNDPNALGPNLFHSFLRFEIGQGETALFTQNVIDGSDPIANVIARVSGGLPSTIDGTLRSAIAGAAFWLVNPAGVLFGAGAQIDVGGTFNVGAADFIVFGDGTQLPVFNDAAVLSIANPVEFGFLETGGGVGQLTVAGVALGGPDDTLTPDGFDGLNLSGRDVRIDAGATVGTAAGTAASGDIAIAADNVAIAGLVSTTTDGVDPAGNIRIGAGSLQLEPGSAVVSSTVGEGNAGHVGLTGDSIALQGSQVSSQTSGIGNSGHVSIAANEVTIESSRVLANTVGAGAAGNVDIFGAEFVKTNQEIRDASGVRDNTNRTFIASENSGLQSGAPGNVTIRSNELVELVNSRVSVFNASDVAAGGSAPSIHVQAPDGVVRLVETNLLSATQGVDDAGDVNVLARDVFIDSSQLQAFTRSIANAGSLSVTGSHSIVTTNDPGSPNVANKVTLISSDSRNAGNVRFPDGSGAAGSVSLHSDGTIDLTGTEVLAFTDTPRIVNDAQGNELRGSISIQGNRVELNESAVVADSSNRAAAGDISITGGDIVVSGARNATTRTANPRPLGRGIVTSAGGSGRAGNVSLNGKSVTLDNTNVAATTSGEGAAGNVDIFGAEFVKTNQQIRDASGVRDNTDRTFIASDHPEDGNRQYGAPGNVTIRSDGLIELVNTRVSVFNRSEIAAGGSAPSIHVQAPDGEVRLVETNLLSATEGVDDAGDVNVLARDVFIDSSRLQAFTRSVANAGSLSVTGTNSIVTTNDQGAPNVADKVTRISSDSRNAGNQRFPDGSGAAGSVSLHSDGTIDLTGTEVLAFTDTPRVVRDAQGNERRGNISIEGNRVELNESTVAADSSNRAAAGDISITGGDIVVSGGRDAITPTANPRPLGRGIVTSAGGSGRAGSVSLSGKSVTLDNTNVAATTSARGAAGNVDIFGAEFVKTNQQIRDASGVRDNTDRTFIASDHPEDGNRQYGAPGNVTIRSDGLIELVNTRVSVFNRSNIAAGGSAPTITVEAPDGTVNLVEVNLLSATEGVDDAGDVNVLARDVFIDSSRLQAFTRSVANAGSLSVTGTNSIVTTNDQGAPNVADKVTRISSDSRNAGNQRFPDGSGAAGSVSLHSDGTIDLTGTEVLAFTDTPRVVRDAQGNERRGSISIEGNRVELNESAVVADSSNRAAAGDISISGGEIVVSGARNAIAPTANPRPLGSGIVASAGGTGRAGTITLNGTSITLQDANVAALTAGRGAAGDIDIFGAEFVKTNQEVRDATGVRDGSVRTSIASDNVSRQTGAPGNIAIRSNGLIELVNTQVSVFNRSNIASGGDAPTITVEVPNGTATLVEVNLLSATEGVDDAGDVNVLARDVLIDSSRLQAFTRSIANAGSLSVTGTNSIVTTNDPGAPNVADKATLISSDSRNAGNARFPDGSGAAGSVALHSDGTIDLTGTEVLAFTDTPRIVNDAQGNELRGNISIQGNRVALNESAVVADSSNRAAAGDINISGSEIVVTGARSAVSGTANPRPLGRGVVVSAVGAGHAGNVTLNGTSVFLTTGGRLESSTSASGAGGSVRVNANELTIAGDGSGLFSESNGAGPGGQIQIGSAQSPVQRISLSDLASINSNASADGDGGSTAVFGVDLDISDSARIESRAAGTGDSGSIALSVQNDLRLSTPVGAQTQTGVFTDSVRSTGGSITIAVGDEFEMTNSRIASSVQEDDGKGGDVAIETRSLLMQSSQILAQADAGNGGQISINRVRASNNGASDPTLGFFLIDTQSVINADSASGINGEISIDAPDVDVSSAIVPQDARIVHADELAPDFCAGTNKVASSFMIVDRGGMAPAPDEYLSAGFDPVAEGNLWTFESPIRQGPPVTALASVAPCSPAN